MLSQMHPSDPACTKVYIKTVSTDPGRQYNCTGGIHVQPDVLIECKRNRCESLASLMPTVNHLVMCENQGFKLATLAPGAFALGSERLKRVGMVNQGPQFKGFPGGAFAGLRLEKLDLRNTTSVTHLSEQVFDAVQTDMVLLNDASLCSSVTALGFKAQYGPYISDVLAGANCPNEPV